MAEEAAGVSGLTAHFAPNDDDTKFFLVPPGQPPSPRCAATTAEDASNRTDASAANFAVSSNSGSGTSGSELQRHQQHLPNQCLVGTSFIIESTCSLAAAAAAGVDGPSTGAAAVCKSEPVETSRANPWHAVQSQYHLSQHQHLHHIQQHHQMNGQEPPTKLMLLPPTLTAEGLEHGGHGQGREAVALGPIHEQGAPKRCRTNLTEEQKMELEKTFAKSRYPDYPTVDELSRRIGLPYKKVLVWFKNRRAKEKRTRKTDFDHCAGLGQPYSTASTSARDSGTASNSAAAAAAAAAAFNAATQRYQTLAQYSIRPCLPAPAYSPHQCQPQNHHTATYWMEHEPAPASAVTMKSEPDFFHYQQQQEQEQPYFSQFPSNQQATHYVFVPGESIATQTSPSMMLDVDATVDAENGGYNSGRAKDNNNNSEQDSGDTEQMLMKEASLPSAGESQPDQAGVRSQQPGSYLPPFSVAGRLSSSAAAADPDIAAIQAAFGSVSGVFLDEAGRIP